MKILFLIFLLYGCSHDFKGGRPDFTKSGPEATAEFEKFEIKELNPNLATMEGDGFVEGYTKTKSLLPLIKDVSPEAYEDYQDLSTHRAISWGLFTTTMAFALLPLFEDQEDRLKWQGWYWGSLGAFFGHGLFLTSWHSDVAEKYNKDLHLRFAPGLGFKSDF